MKNVNPEHIAQLRSYLLTLMHPNQIWNCIYIWIQQNEITMSEFYVLKQELDKFSQS